MQTVRPKIAAGAVFADIRSNHTEELVSLDKYGDDFTVGNRACREVYRTPLTGVCDAAFYAAIHGRVLAPLGLPHLEGHHTGATADFLSTLGKYAKGVSVVVAPAD